MMRRGTGGGGGGTPKGEMRIRQTFSPRSTHKVHLQFEVLLSNLMIGKMGGSHRGWAGAFGMRRGGEGGGVDDEDLIDF